MSSRAMIVVGGGAGSRFGSDKLLAVVGTRPLISHTYAAVFGLVDRCVVVCRPESMEAVAELVPGAVVTSGGVTRTLSEMAGLAALGEEPELIGIHDAARPLVRPGLVNALFEMAAVRGGAIPVLEPEGMILDRRTHRPVSGLRHAQTPQVFRGKELMTAYVHAARIGFEGHDTAEVVQRFTDLEVVAVPGDPDNLKVTYPADLDLVRVRLEGPSRT